MKNEFTKAEAAKAAELRPTVINFYTDQGLVRPDIADPQGRGTVRLYSYENIIQFALARKLVEFGLSIKVAREILNRAMDAGLWSTAHRRFWKSNDGSRVFLTVRHNPGTDDFEAFFETRMDPRSLKELLHDKEDPAFDLIPVPYKDDEVRVDLGGYLAALVIDVTKIARRIKA